MVVGWKGRRLVACDVWSGKISLWGMKNTCAIWYQIRAVTRHVPYLAQLLALSRPHTGPGSVETMVEA